MPSDKALNRTSPAVFYSAVSDRIKQAIELGTFPAPDILQATSEDRQRALDALSETLAWAEVGQQSAPQGKTVIDLNYAGKVIRAALSRPDVPHAPAGWKLVPVEPTHEMTGQVLEPMEDRRELVRAYKAMLSAAPQPPHAPDILQAVDVEKVRFCRDWLESVEEMLMEIDGELHGEDYQALETIRTLLAAVLKGVE